MKIGGYIMLTLTVALVLTCCFLLIADFQQGYPEVQNTSDEQWTKIQNKTEYSISGINATANKLRNLSQTMNSEEASWLSQFVAGAIMIPMVPIMVFQVMVNMGRVASIIPLFADAMGVPPIIVGILIAMFWICLVFAVVTVLWRYKSM